MRSIAHDPGVAALLERADKVLAGGVEDELAEDIAATIKDIRVAESAGDKEKVEELCDELIDLLMEAED